MPPDKNQNINLLPNDQERKRAVIKQVILQAPRKEYTNPPKPIRVPTPPKYNTIIREKIKPIIKAAEVKFSRMSSPPKYDNSVVSKKEELTNTVPLVQKNNTSTPNLIKTDSQASVAHWWDNIFSKKISKQNKVEKTETKSMPIMSKEQLKPEIKNSEKLKLEPVTPDTKETNDLTTEKEAMVMVDPKEDIMPKHKDHGDDFGVNLLSKEYAKEFKPQNQKVFFAWSIGLTILLIVLFYAGIYLYELRGSRQLTIVETANRDLEKTIISFKDLEGQDKILNKKVMAAEGLLANHMFWRSFLEKLESVTIPEVTYLNIAASNNGSVSISAQAIDYTALGRQITVFQEAVPWIKESNVSGANLEIDKEGKTGVVVFDLVLKVDPEIFKAKFEK